MLARLIVRFYRDKIVDFHSNLYIANITGKWMTPFMFSSHQISNSTCLRGEPLSLSYSLFLMDYPYFLSIRSFLSNRRREPNGVEEDPTSSFRRICAFTIRRKGESAPSNLLMGNSDWSTMCTKFNFCKKYIGLPDRVFSVRSIYEGDKSEESL